MRAYRPAARGWFSGKDRTRQRHAARRGLFRLLLLLACSGTVAEAQDMPRLQVFGGYSYTRFDSKSFGFANPADLNGYTFSPAFNLTHGFGVAAELSGQYTRNLNLRDLAVGPQFVYPRGPGVFFAHVLVGDARSFVRVGNGEGDTDRAVILGGGMDWGLSSRFAVRLFQVDYVRTNLFQTKQNNLRFSAGLVYTWGKIHRKGRRAPAQSP